MTGGEETRQASILVTVLLTDGVITEKEADILSQAIKNEFNPDWDPTKALQDALHEYMAEVQRLNKLLADKDKALKLALEALLAMNPYPASKEHIRNEAITALRQLTRKWVGLTLAEFKQATDGLEDLEDCCMATEDKLGAKNR